MFEGTHLYYRRVEVLSESQENADAGVEMLARSHATHIAVQTAQGQRVAGSTHHISS